MYFLRQSWHQTFQLRRTNYCLFLSNDYSKLGQNALRTRITEAEEVVGYPILCHKVITTHLDKLFETNVPVLNIIKDLLMNSNKLSWRLIVLLVSKAGGYVKSSSPVDKDTTPVSGILYSQRILGELSDILKCAYQLHRGFTTIDDKTDNNLITFNKKATVLCGHYLLSNSFHQLANLKNQEIFELMWGTLRDMTEFEFIVPRDKYSNPLPCKPIFRQRNLEVPDGFGTKPLDMEPFLGNAKCEWVARNILGGASLLGKSCQGVLILAGHNENIQRKAYELGKHIALSLKAASDYNSVVNNLNFSLDSAPVLFYLQRSPSFYSKIERPESYINYTAFRKVLLESCVLEDTILLQHEFCKNSLNILNEFNDGDAKSALLNIIDSTKL